MAEIFPPTSTALPTDPPPEIAAKHWWLQVAVLVRNGVAIVAALGMLPAAMADQVTAYILGVIISVALIVSEGMTIKQLIVSAYQAVADKVNNEVRSQEIVAEREKSQNSVRVEELRLESARVESLTASLRVQALRQEAVRVSSTGPSSSAAPSSSGTSSTPSQ